MFTRAHAPMASKKVHRSVGGIRDAGTTVEKTESASGECLNDPPEYGSTPWWNR